jgi:hypothetical protein
MEQYRRHVLDHRQRDVQPGPHHRQQHRPQPRQPRSGQPTAADRRGAASYTHPEPHVDANADRYLHADGDRNTFTDCFGYAFAHCGRYRNTHLYSNAHADRYSPAFTNCDRDDIPARDGLANSDSYADRDAASYLGRSQ